MQTAIEPEADIAMTDWSSQTSWTIAAGSLQDCITFESSLSSADDGADEVEATSVDSTLKSRLILYPSSPDSGPCEIKINLEQKHEIMQVYVRSTARVYEIYSEPNLQSSSEYLFTVRCGIASRDGEVIRALNVEEIVSSHIKGFNKELAEENIRNEDDWVDVKVPDSPVLDGVSNGLQIKSCVNSAKSSQELFEATAEITDANPCISLTLRLLSLQNKGCICVDEIYVFGDPVAPSERQESLAENSSGSSLMAMFLPTLMQLSKTTGLSRINEKYPPVRKEKQYISEIDLGKAHPSDSVINTQLEEKASITNHHEVEQQKVNEDSVGPSQTDIPLQDAPMESNSSDTPSQAAKMESNHSHMPSQTAQMKSIYSDTPSQAPTRESNHGDSLNGNVERILEQLVCRMDRIEGICLGFQEKMLMPISSIEARLQQVEQQLETLTMKLQNSGLPSCSRVYPPDNSCIQSDANSYDNCHGYNVTGGIKSDKKSSHIEVLSVYPNDMSDSANTTQLLPGLVVTAPEFPDGEDEEESNALRSEMNSSKDKQRQNLSIDDAVASALAGFLSSVSLETPRYTKSLTVRAPEFTIEDDHENNDASPRTLHEIEENDLVHPNDTESIRELTSHNIHTERGEKTNRDPNDKQSDETAKEAEHSDQLCSGEDDQVEVGVEASTLAEHNPRTGFDHVPDDNKTENISCQASDGLSTTSDNANLHQIDDISSTTQGEVGASTDLSDTVATEVPKRASHEDIIENYLGFSHGSSVVDFKIPILDVQFTSQKNSATRTILEALLVDTPKTNFQDHPVGKSSDDHLIRERLKSNGELSAVEQYNLVSVNVDDPANPVTNIHFSMDRDYDALMNVPVDDEGNNMQEDHKLIYDEFASSSLI